LLSAKVAQRRDDESIHRLYGDDQLRALLAAQDPVRHREDVSLGSSCLGGAAAACRRLLRDGGSLVESAGAAVPEAQTILRAEGPSPGAPGSACCARLFVKQRALTPARFNALPVKTVITKR